MLTTLAPPAAFRYGNAAWLQLITPLTLTSTVA